MTLSGDPIFIVLLIFACATSYPACKSLLRPPKHVNTTHAEGAHEVYEDEDGIATHETEVQYLAARRPWLILALATLGIALSFATVVLEGISQEPTVASLLISGSWLCSFLQAAAYARERQISSRFTLSNSLGLSASFIILGLVARVLRWHSPAVDGSEVVIVALDCLAASQCLVASALLLIAVCIPRRPFLIFRGLPVDDQYTVSFIQRLSFAWASSTLRQARFTISSLKLSDLPTVDNAMRASSLRARFMSFRCHNVLWKEVYFCHKSEIITIYMLAVLHSAVQLSPSWVLYRLLRFLEQRSPAASNSGPLWSWVAALGFSVLFAAWLETQLLWAVNTRLTICLRSELITYIYAKLLMKKNVLSAPKPEQLQCSEGVESGPQVDSLKNDVQCSTAEVDKSKALPVPAPAPQDSNHDATNLVALDTKRVTNFLGASFLIPDSIAKLAISMAFLIQLIGWKSVVLGLVTLALLNPLNVYLSRLMTAAQSEIMQIRDQKLSLINEALQGIRQIKFTATEAKWLNKIEKRRNEELSVQWYIFILRTALVGFWQVQPILFSAVSLAVYATLTGSLSPSIAFTSIAIFGQMEGSLSLLPNLFVQMQQAAVSMARIERFLGAAEQTSYVDREKNDRSFNLNSASLAWPTEAAEPDPAFVLRELSICFPNGKLSVIGGDTGSGKSLLLNALVGEAEILSGSVAFPARDPRLVGDGWMSKAWPPSSDTAFVSQFGWIENATIRDNILFGLPLREIRYRQTIFACALTKDLEMLADGDATEVGVGGINLSGGQKWRLSFARALYSRASVLVIDDIFSAVDAHVGRHMYDHALTGPLAQFRTRIIATHHVDLCLAKAQYFVRLDRGRAIEARPITRGAQEKHDELGEAEKDTPSTMDSTPRSTDFSKSLLHDLEGREGENLPQLPLDARKPRKFIEEERREIGAVKLSTYRFYLKATGGVTMLLVVICAHLGYTGSVVGRSWWLRLWSGTTEKAATVQGLPAISPSQYVLHDGYHTPYRVQLDGTAATDRLHYYLAIYLAISFLVCVVGILKFMSVLIGSIKASKKLFEEFTWTILHAPTSWLDTVPTGRILNRFTSDFDAVDSSLADGLGFFLTMCFQLFAILIAGVVVSPYIVLVAAVLLSISGNVARLYLPGARDVKRLESVARSPVLEQFQSTIAGVETIRAYGKAERYLTRMMDKIDEYARTSYHRSLFNLWLMLRLNLIGAAFTTTVAAAIIVRQDVNASLAGFALSFALQYTEAVEWTIRQFSATQLAMNSTERILEYSAMKTEPQPHSGQIVPAAWPASGRLDIDDLVVGYESQEPVLKGITMHIEPGERIGIVGRTGAGKSTLSLALFRFLEATSGSIFIDGVDIGAIRLHDLRSRLAIIPQDPVLFTGTLRLNLDPLNEYTDTDLCDVLARVRFTSSAGSEDRPEPDSQETKSDVLGLLSKHISQGGHNLSHGQRQLLCMARAVLSRSKIMIMDEATSSVDVETDAAIQKSIRHCFEGSTLIVIAHRLSTLADFDKIFVFEAGKVVEHGSPRELLLRRGPFWKLVQDSGEKKVIEKTIHSS